ncbi:MAG: glycosyltransferase family 4 protein [Rhodoblastus sp.]
MSKARCGSCARWRRASPKFPCGSTDRSPAALNRPTAALHEKYRDWFAGRVEHIGDIYAGARLALLPTTSGTGLSIKSVEAMASGLPLIATTHAFRGMNLDPSALSNVTLADDAEAFAAALRKAAAAPTPTPAERAKSASRAAYDAHFSEAAYCARLAAIATPLVR